LRDVAPTVAVRGNVDSGTWAMRLPRTLTVTLGSHTIYVLHILDDLDIEPPQADISAVIYGHSHKPSIEDRDGVLYLNPGAAGPRRFRLPISVARLTEVDGRLRAEIIELVAADAR
jgi:putative phosphoesterase